MEEGRSREQTARLSFPPALPPTNPRGRWGPTAPLMSLPSNEGGRQVTSNPNTALHVIRDSIPLGAREGPLTQTKRSQEVTSQEHRRTWPGVQGKLQASLGSADGVSGEGRARSSCSGPDPR